MSLGLIGEAAGAAACGMTACAGPVPCWMVICPLSSMFGAEELFDCRPIGAGEIIEAGAGTWLAGAVWAGSSAAGIGGAELVSSSVIAILKVPSTITTTLAPTSSERIFAVMLEPSVPAAPLASAGLSLEVSFGLSLATAFLRALLSLFGAAAAA